MVDRYYLGGTNKKTTWSYQSPFFADHLVLIMRTTFYMIISLSSRELKGQFHLNISERFSRIMLRREKNNMLNIWYIGDGNHLGQQVLQCLCSEVSVEFSYGHNYPMWDGTWKGRVKIREAYHTTCIRFFNQMVFRGGRHSTWYLNYPGMRCSRAIRRRKALHTGPQLLRAGEFRVSFNVR